MKKYFKSTLSYSGQFTIVILLSLGLFSCSTYYISIESFNKQFKEIDSLSLKMVNVIGPLGERYSYRANTIDTIDCTDDKGKLIKLVNSPSIEIRFIDKNDEHTTFYFDTIYLRDSMIVGGKSRFLPSIRDSMPITAVKLIKIQDGKKKFDYERSN
jgi:hypothetical protein